MTDIMKRKNFHSKTIYKFKLKNAKELKLRTRKNENSRSVESSPNRNTSKPCNNLKYRCSNRVSKLNTIDEVINLIKITDSIDLFHLCQDLANDNNYNSQFVQSIQSQSLTYSFQSSSPPPSSKCLEFEDELKRDSNKLRSREFWNDCWLSYISYVHPIYPIFSLKYFNCDNLSPYLKSIVYTLGYYFKPEDQEKSNYILDYMEKCNSQWLKKILFEPKLTHIQFLLLLSIYYHYSNNQRKSGALQNQILQMSYSLGLPNNFNSNNSLKNYESYLTWLVISSFRWEVNGFKLIPDNFPDSPIQHKVLDHNWQFCPPIFADHSTLISQCISQKIQFELEFNQILLTNTSKLQLGNNEREGTIIEKTKLIQKLFDRYMNYFNLIIQYYPHLNHQILKVIIQDVQYKLEVIKFLLQSDTLKLKSLLKLEENQNYFKKKKFLNYLILLKLINLSNYQSVNSILKPNLNTIKRLMAQLNLNSKNFYLKLVLFKFFFSVLK